MIITKYEHACFTVQEDNTLLIIDPGAFSNVPTLKKVAAIILTHVHGDHVDESKIKQIITDNPGIKVFSTQEVADAFPTLQPLVVQPGTMHQIGAFTLAFFGGEHATIHPSWPRAQNIGVLINSTLYYPGDSFVLPGRPIKVLAAPAAAPWLKISEAIDFISEVKPELAFPTHDAILSKEGQQVQDSMLEPAAKKAGTKYQRLQIGQSITV